MMKLRFSMLAVVVMLTMVSAISAQDEPPAPVTIAFEDGACEAQIPMGTAYHPSTQEASIGTLDGGVYTVVEASALVTEFWVSVRTDQVADLGAVWVNGSDFQVNLTTDCLFNSGFGTQEPAADGEPPAPTTMIKFPYGGCILQSTVGTPTHPSVQEAASGETALTQIIVLNASVVDDTQWIGVYGGDLGLPVYVTPSEFIEGNFTALTASCLYIPLVSSIS